MTLQPMVMTGASIYFGFFRFPDATWGARAFYVFFAAMGLYFGLIVYAMNFPLQFPVMTKPSRTQFRFRLPHVAMWLRRLENAGFQRVGVRGERLGITTMQVMELWNPEMRTFASLAAWFGIPRYSLLTPLEDGRMVSSDPQGFSHRVVLGRKSASVTVAGRLENHTSAVQSVDSSVVSQVPSNEELLDWKVDLTKTKLVALYGTDEDWETWTSTDTVEA